ncbi:iron-sulfur cluster repair di-iron protein [Rhodocytophaga aerolata]|uniref:Iron-sulfur cluster repair di-iron protein n=1 Tax=Rhodocytophaga aerolata TaxID=455078 RepID=A0ABT8R7Y4_9BACT|nr:iron-sulfur cluster repair di-iron protein [Rhodocytophaga aerolata]MDO1448207.1 iron-sulfur cluster repair di-iron protein [Rhodocytophaga aerolata]
MNTLLDVRTLEPRFKHPFIFKNFDQLLYGEILTLVNDHDPIPLYYQFESERTGSFNWEYEAKGPDIWKIKITKTQHTSETVGDIVRKNPKAAAVFKKYKIDFCCNGNRLFEEVCAEAGLVPAELKEEISQSTEEAPAQVHADNWSLNFLIEYIIQNHHSYVLGAIPKLEESLLKVVKAHGVNHPELAAIAGHFTSLARELMQHMQKEEQILFPVIKEMVVNQKKGVKTTIPFGSVRNPIRVMEDEHAGAGEDIESIRRLSNNFTPPTDACFSYRLLYKQLEEFEEDLHQHVHLENNILFPKAIALESTFNR